ncbi:MAG: hypothetical protein ACO2PN_29660 [Pyrobaculum sp.]
MRPTGIEAKPQQPPRQIANLSHVNLNTYVDSYRSAPRQCNDAIQQSSTRQRRPRHSRQNPAPPRHN